MDISISPPPLSDSKLDDLNDQIKGMHSKLLEYIPIEKEGPSEYVKNSRIRNAIITDVFDLVSQAQKRINEMIDETYK